MLQQVVEYQIPSPVEGLQFQMTTVQPNSAPTFTVRGNNVFMAMLTQQPGTQSLLFQWTATSNIWDSEQPGQFVNYFATLGLPAKTWVLQIVTPR